MDAWQTSVETRLTALDNRLGRVDDRLGKVESALATITERVSHLPTKGWAVTSLLLMLAAIAGLVTFQGNIQKMVNPSSASSPPQIEAGRNSN